MHHTLAACRRAITRGPRLGVLLALLVVALLPATIPAIANADQTRPRVIMTTDGEGDDQASMRRLVLYANDFEIEGIIHSSSFLHWAGDPTANPPIAAASSWTGTQWAKDIISTGYAQSYPSLVQNDPRYPTPEKLLSAVKPGNIKSSGEMAEDTEGSELIKKALLDDKPGPVYLGAWGGTNTIASALRSIRDEFFGTPSWDAVYRKVSDKAF